MVGLLKFGGNSFSLLLSFMFTLTFQVLMLQKLLLLFSKGANPSPGASPVFLTVTQVNQYTCIARSALCTGNYDLYVLVTQVSKWKTTGPVTPNKKDLNPCVRGAKYRHRRMAPDCEKPHCSDLFVWGLICQNPLFAKRFCKYKSDQANMSIDTC